MHTGMEVRVGGKSIVSGENSFDYSNPVSFTVVAKDGSTKDYRVYVSSVSVFTIGGFVSGLGSGKYLVAQNNGGNNTTVTANGNFSFNTAVANNGLYSVSILTNPSNQSCSVSNASGTATSNVNNVIIDCNNLPGTNIPNFTDIGNGTIKDNNTGLVWQKCSKATYTNIINCASGTISNTNTWASAVSYCTGLTLNGNIWHLPSVVELNTIIDLTKSTAPTISLTYFPDVPSSSVLYWTTTIWGQDSTQALYIDHQDGSSNNALKTSSSNYYVRCVSNP